MPPLPCILATTTPYIGYPIAYTLAAGRPIPDGLEIDHVLSRGCIHRNCFEPLHLEAVTRETNQARKSQAVREKLQEAGRKGAQARWGTSRVPPECKEPGCTKTVKARGWCGTHYAKMRREAKGHLGLLEPGGT